MDKQQQEAFEKVVNSKRPADLDLLEMEQSFLSTMKSSFMRHEAAL